MLKDKATYSDVVKFYAKKDESEEYRKKDNQKQPFINVARAVNEVRGIPEDINGFEDFASWIKLDGKKVIIDNKRDDLNPAIISTDSIEDIPYYNLYVRTKEIEGKEYLVNSKADDYVFAWFIIKSKKNDWKTVSIYEENNGEQEDFYEWFFERCKKINGSYIPGQKWHLFQYILYQEINSKYGFSAYGGWINDLEKEEFTYYKYARCPELVLWMAEEANCKRIEEAKSKAKEMKEDKEWYQTICEEITREIIPWSEIKERIFGEVKK